MKLRSDVIRVRDIYGKLRAMASGHDHWRHFDSTIIPWLSFNIPHWGSLRDGERASTPTPRK